MIAEALSLEDVTIYSSIAVKPKRLNTIKLGKLFNHFCDPIIVVWRVDFYGAAEVVGLLNDSRVAVFIQQNP